MSDASEKTQFKQGNEFWKARSSHGRKPRFATPEDLEDACLQYFKWNEENPLISMEVVKYQGVGTLTEVPKMRAMTIIGLCQFLDISRRAWSIYSDKPDFVHTCKWAEDMIYRQKVEGAASDLLNAGFIGKEIGLVDKQEVTTKEPIKHIESEYVDP